VEVRIKYDKGTLLISGDARVPSSHWDARSGAYRALALDYADITDYLESSHINYVDEALELLPVPRLQFHASLRDYQTDALDSWIQAGKRGTVVLPTGAGKTIVAVGSNWHAANAFPSRCSTLDLVEQWRRVLAAEFAIEIGTYGGGENVLKPLTVSTYDSAYLARRGARQSIWARHIRRGPSPARAGLSAHR